MSSQLLHWQTGLSSMLWSTTFEGCCSSVISSTCPSSRSVAALLWDLCCKYHPSPDSGRDHSKKSTIPFLPVSIFACTNSISSHNKKCDQMSQDCTVQKSFRSTLHCGKPFSFLTADTNTIRKQQWLSKQLIPLGNIALLLGCESAIGIAVMVVYGGILFHNAKTLTVLPWHVGVVYIYIYIHTNSIVRRVEIVG